MAAISLKGRNVVIGGGAKNLGGLISRTLAADGANIAVHYNSDRTGADAEATVAAVKKTGADAFAIQGDLTRVSEVVRLFETAAERFGAIDIAINTVGNVMKKPLLKQPKPSMTRCSRSTPKPPTSSFKRPGGGLTTMAR